MSRRARPFYTPKYDLSNIAIGSSDVLTIAVASLPSLFCVPFKLIDSSHVFSERVTKYAPTQIFHDIKYVQTYILFVLLIYPGYRNMSSLLYCRSTVVTCIVLMPVMWHMWIVAGSGNANLYLALIHNISTTLVTPKTNFYLIQSFNLLFIYNDQQEDIRVTKVLVVEHQSAFYDSINGHRTLLGGSLSDVGRQGLVLRAPTLKQQWALEVRQ
ncbi:unnamed protein product [Strongylus vulgaris]|uniref:Uncharacterized protein n=1 Tax=Strongylus vulgaris TaxID=40348 RepID=A0A3P7IRD1_STRVU|nr:unnamed protein product [Strongylus vulgaris]